jgi:hypothetical protein
VEDKNPYEPKSGCGRFGIVPATKDNTAKRKWIGNTKCRFCECEDSIHHLFFSCDTAKYVWSCVAKAIGAPRRPGLFSYFFGGFPNFYQLGAMFK